MVTPQSIQLAVIREVGDTPDNVLQRESAALWDRYADKAYIFPRLQEYYFKCACIDRVLGTLRNQVNMSVDGALSIRLGDRIKYLQDRLAETCKLIEKWESTARANRQPVVGPMVTTNIETASTSVRPATIVPDANDPRYRGNPYERTVLRPF